MYHLAIMAASQIYDIMMMPIADLTMCSMIS